MTRRLIACLTVFVIFVGIEISLKAQNTVSVPYTVRDGDNLWNLAGVRLDDPLQWEVIYERNPFLKEPGRRFTRDGKVIVLLHPGEKLLGLDELGIIPTFESLDNLRVGQQPVVIDRAVIPSWFWWLLGAIALALVAWWLYTRNPTQWRPRVPNGIRDDAEAEREFQRLAATQHMTMVPGSQERIRLFGTWNTRHQGVPVAIPHNYNGQRAWRTRFRNANGQEETRIMTQECGNDVTFQGTRYIPGPNARIEEGWGEQAPATPVVEGTPTVTQTPVTSEQSEKLDLGDLKFEIKQPDETHNQALIRMVGVDQTQATSVEVKDGDITFRFTPKSAPVAQTGNEVRSLTAVK